MTDSRSTPRLTALALTLAALLTAAGSAVTDPGWTAPALYTGQNTACSFSAAGDCNGDGFDDVIIGVPGGGAVAGHVDVYYGGPEGPSTTQADWTAFSGTAGDGFGATASKAGDVDNDGYGDVVVGAPYADGGLGRIYVFRGGPGGLSATWTWTAAGSGGGYAEYALMTAGDVDADGRDEIIVGAWTYMAQGAREQYGHAYVYKVNAVSQELTLAWDVDGSELVGPSGDVSRDVVVTEFGMAVSTAGDVNGDGCDDVIIGAPTGSLMGLGGDQRFQSRAYVFHGSRGGLSRTPGWAHSMINAQPTSPDDRDLGPCAFGTCVAGAGDMNGDGYDDVLVSAPGVEVPMGGGGLQEAGRVYLFSGSANGLGAPTWSVDGPEFNQRFGTSVGSAGDVNGDGYPDVVVGSIEYKAYIYFGSAAGPSSLPGETIDRSALFARDFQNLWWVWTGSVGDVNGDGAEDFLVAGTSSSVDDSRAEIFLGTGDVGALQQLTLGTSKPIAPHGVSVGSGVLLRARVATDLPAHVEFEVAKVAEAFDGQETHLSGAARRGDVASVEITGLDLDCAYHWRARLVPADGPPRQWFSYGRRPEDVLETDFSTRSNEAPAGQGAGQILAEQGTPIEVGGLTIDRAPLRFQVAPSDSHDDAVRFEVELRPVDVDFSGTPTLSSPLLASGNVVALTALVPNGSYHWQWRLVDEFGADGSWQGFGGNPETSPDFTVGADGSRNGTTCLGGAGAATPSWMWALPALGLLMLVAPRSLAGSR